MSLLAPKAACVLLLEYMLNSVAPSNVKLHLYSNNHTPAESDTISNYTESTGAGYAAVTLTGTSWVVTQDATQGADATYAQQTFTYTGSDTLYGYYVTDNSSTNLLWAELFVGGPFNVPTAGGSVQVTPNLHLF